MIEIIVVSIFLFATTGAAVWALYEASSKDKEINDLKTNITALKEKNDILTNALDEYVKDRDGGKYRNLKTGKFVSRKVFFKELWA